MFRFIPNMFELFKLLENTGYYGNYCPFFIGSEERKIFLALIKLDFYDL